VSPTTHDSQFRPGPPVLIFAPAQRRDISETKETDEQGAARKAIRTVTPEFFGRPDREMDVVGWLLFVGIIVVFVPLLPFILLIWLVSVSSSSSTGRRGEGSATGQAVGERLSPARTGSHASSVSTSGNGVPSSCSLAYS
jgi:hypothetical protein